MFQNVRSLHLHIDDVRSDYNIIKANVNIFVETNLCSSDTDDTYTLSGYTRHRNDYRQSNERTCYETAVDIKNHLICSRNPYRMNFNKVEMTVMVLDHLIHRLHIVGIYRSKTVPISQVIDSLRYLHDFTLTENEIPIVILGDFNVDLMKLSSEQKALTKYLINEKGYTQMINQYTTDYRTQIDHIYTNVPHQVKAAGTLESYYSDHEPIVISLKHL